MQQTQAMVSHSSTHHTMPLLTSQHVPMHHPQQWLLGPLTAAITPLTGLSQQQLAIGCARTLSGTTASASAATAAATRASAAAEAAHQRHPLAGLRLHVPCWNRGCARACLSLCPHACLSAYIHAWSHMRVTCATQANSQHRTIPPNQPMLHQEQHKPREPPAGVTYPWLWLPLHVPPAPAPSPHPAQTHQAEPTWPWLLSGSQSLQDTQHSTA